jgi:hypothetical protein
MRNPVLVSEIQKVFYINAAAIGGRTTVLLPLWDGEQWHSWIPIGEGKLIKMQMHGVAQGDYFAKTPESEGDLFIPFVDLMWQRASWPNVVSLIRAIEESFLKMATSVAKLKHAFYTRGSLPQGALRNFANTEVEYLIVSCRTVFDLLQELIMKLWKGVTLADAEAELKRKGQSLPETFSKMCLQDKARPYTAEEIQTKFGLPLIMAQQYVQAEPFFSTLRDIRNGIVHSGSGIEMIFETERGFCIPKDSRLIQDIPYSQSAAYNENLVSLMPWLAELVTKTITTCTEIVAAFASIIQMAEELAPGYRVFVRNPSSSALVELLAIKEGGSPWWDDPNSPIPDAESGAVVQLL